MGNKNLVSVIMPTYNRAGIIDGAIKSVLEQSHDNFELIIVNDGSTDNTEHVVKEFNDSRIVYYEYYPNKGGNHARNIGLKLARGEYISFLDSDNKWESKFLETQLESLVKYEADISICRVRIYSTQCRNEQIVPAINHDVFTNEGLVDIDIINHSMLKENMIDTNVVCIKRKCVIENDGFNEKLKRMQDWEFFLRLLMTRRYKVAFVPQIMVNNFLQNDSIRFRHDVLETFLYVFEKYFYFYQAWGLVNEQCERIINYTMERKGGFARQDTLVGLLRFLPENIVEDAIVHMGLNDGNFKAAQNIDCRVLLFGQKESVLKVTEKRGIVLYGGGKTLIHELMSLKGVLLSRVQCIVSDERDWGMTYSSIPFASLNILLQSTEKFFVLVLDEYAIRKIVLQELGYLEGVDFIDYKYLFL